MGGHGARRRAGSPLTDAASLKAWLTQIGPRWHLDIRAHSQAVKEAYAQVLASASREGFEQARDVRYGPHERHRLDIVAPVGAEGAPVVIFVHGGAFVRGDKRTSEEIHDNVLRWFARRGFVGVNVEYRLAPEAVYPGGAHDVGRAIEWARSNVARHGGDPHRLLLVGHSAGGTHAAAYAFDPAIGAFGRHVTALVLISARLRADRRAVNPNAESVAAYFGTDPALDEERSPVSHVACSDVPVMVAIAEFENPLLDVYGIEFAAGLARHRGRSPRVLQLMGHNHMSMVAHFDSGEDLLGREILAFFEAAEHGRRAMLTGPP